MSFRKADGSSFGAISDPLLARPQDTKSYPTLSSFWGTVQFFDSRLLHFMTLVKLLFNKGFLMAFCDAVLQRGVQKQHRKGTEAI